jgi:hypothetical protein
MLRAQLVCMSQDAILSIALLVRPMAQSDGHDAPGLIDEFHATREGYGEQPVQFFIIEMLDGVRKVFRRDMPPRIRRLSWICRRRRRVLNIRCREGIGLAPVKSSGESRLKMICQRSGPTESGPSHSPADLHVACSHVNARVLTPNLSRCQRQSPAADNHHAENSDYRDCTIAVLMHADDSR